MIGACGSLPRLYAFRLVQICLHDLFVRLFGVDAVGFPGDCARLRRLLSAHFQNAENEQRNGAERDDPTVCPDRERPRKTQTRK